MFQRVRQILSSNANELGLRVCGVSLLPKLWPLLFPSLLFPPSHLCATFPLFYATRRCSLPVESLFIEYSEKNFRLTRCSHCGRVADKYIEFELLLVLIDIVLHRKPAYRHLLFNRYHPLVGEVSRLVLGTLHSPLAPTAACALTGRCACERAEGE